MQQQRRTLCGDAICFLFITPLASLSGWLCVQGAMDLYYSNGMEAVGLIVLTLTLFTIYFFWTVVSSLLFSAQQNESTMTFYWLMWDYKLFWFRNQKHTISWMTPRMILWELNQIKVQNEKINNKSVKEWFKKSNYDKMVLTFPHNLIFNRRYPYVTTFTSSGRGMRRIPASDYRFPVLWRNIRDQNN